MNQIIKIFFNKELYLYDRYLVATPFVLITSERHLCVNKISFRLYIMVLFYMLFLYVQILFYCFWPVIYNTFLTKL